MTSKQRAYLKGLAMTMDPIFQFGKNSLTPENTAAIAANMNSATHSLKESHLNIINVLLRLRMMVLYSGILLRTRTELSLT